MSRPRTPQPGDRLPTLEMRLPAWRLVAYQGSTWDFHRGHHDWSFAKSVGDSAPYADGQMFGALMARHLMDWTGPTGFLRSLSFRLRDMVHAGDSIAVRGSVLQVSDLGPVAAVSVELDIIDVADGREIATGSASVEVAYPGSEVALGARRIGK